MKNALWIILFWGILSGGLTAQKFFEPSIESMSYLMTNVDTNKWNAQLQSVGLKRNVAEQHANQVEYKKNETGVYQYVGYDIEYGVLTIVWKDESGKKSIVATLKKEVKGHEHNAPNTFKLNHKGVDYVISIESKKDKGVYEMITMEVDRK